jgi:UDPglucose 6-dehydrogenase
MVGSTLGKVLHLFNHIVDFYDKYKTEKTELLKSKGFLVYHNWNSLNLDSYDLVFLTLPTPTFNGKQDLSAIKEVCILLSKSMYDGQTIVLKSTVLPGTTRNVVKPILDRSNLDYELYYNPEFITEHNSIYDMLNQRIVVGSEKLELNIYPRFYNGWQKLALLYEPFHVEKFLLLTWEEAEWIKYISNVILASKVMIFQEVAEWCEKNNVTFNRIKDAIIADERIGSYGSSVNFKQWGGSCFTKDCEALLSFLKEKKYPVEIFESIVKRNRMLSK